MTSTVERIRSDIRFLREADDMRQSPMLRTAAASCLSLSELIAPRKQHSYWKLWLLKFEKRWRIRMIAASDTPTILLWLYALPTWLAELIVFAGWLAIIAAICWGVDKFQNRKNKE